MRLLRSWLPRLALLGADAHIRAREPEEGGLYYEALLGTGRIEESKDVSRQLIQFVSDS